MTHTLYVCSFDGSSLTAYPEVQGLLLQVYSQIGEHDGSYGAHLLFSPKEELTRKLDEHEGRWEELMSESYWRVCAILLSLAFSL